MNQLRTRSARRNEYYAIRSGNTYVLEVYSRVVVVYIYIYIYIAVVVAVVVLVLAAAEVLLV